MKTKRILKIAAACLLLSILHLPITTAFAQGTAFTYQGQIQNSGGPVSGTYNLTFTLYTNSLGGPVFAGPVTNNGVVLTNGLFTTVVDFGAGVFTGSSNWLEIAVETNGGPVFATLKPRQQMTPAPYAIYAETSGSANTVVGGGTGWGLTGNTGTSYSSDFLGTSDNQALELRVNNQVAELLYPFASGYPSVGFGANSGFYLYGQGGSFVGPGGGPYPGNITYGDFTVIGGGYANKIYALGANYSVISGGIQNTLNSPYGVIGGGYSNSNSAGYATIPGGANNIVFPAGTYGFAAGDNAAVANTGSFVWSDASGGAFTSTSDNQFSARAMGGVRFVTGGAGMTIDGQPVPTGSGWGLTGNAGTSYGTDFLGTSDNQALELRVNNQVAELLYPFASGYPSVGFGANSGFYLYGQGGSFVGPGGGPYPGNITYGDFTVIGGGYANKIYALGANYSVISGGIQNTLNSPYGVIGGGYSNSNSASYATIPGGANNIVFPAGTYGFAAGDNATVNNSGSFVWSDASGTTTTSTANNSVTFRASGGYTFYTGTGSGGAQLAAAATSWTAISDRNAKKNFQPVNAVSVLDKLAAIPIEQWNYKWEKDSDVPNIGPMAQDFKQAFYPGRDDKGISTLEFDGVELAAIQGLNQKLEQKETEITELKARLEKLEQMMIEKNGGEK